MSDRKHEEKKHGLSGRLVRAIQRFRVLFAILAVAVLAFPIAFYAVETIGRKNAEEAAAKHDAVEKKYDEYEKETETEKKAAREKEFFALVDEAADRFGDQFAGAKALLLRADVNYRKLTSGTASSQKETLESVLRDLFRVAQRAPQNMLAPLALKKAGELVQNVATLSAASIPTMGELLKLVPSVFTSAQTSPPEKPQDLALLIMQYLIARYPRFVYVTETYVNAAFILEGQGKFKEAGEIYGRLESEYSNDEWTKIAINRRLKLEADGVLND